MRKTERIRPFLEEIAKIWESKVPDWRFGQLIVNFIQEDPFYWEEDKFLEKLNEFFRSANDGK